MPENALKFCQADDMLFCHQLGYFVGTGQQTADSGSGSTWRGAAAAEAAGWPKLHELQWGL